MRDVLSLALLAALCGTALREPIGCTRPFVRAPALRSPVTEKSAAPAAEPSESLAAIAARGAALAPGMREVTRAESTGDKIEVARAAGRDACVRVAFAAGAPVVAKLVDGDGNLLASSAAPAMDGVLAEHGPVCIRKGDAVSAVAEGAGATVRWVAWASP